MKKMTVSVIIPNWNGRGLLEKHLPSVRAAAKNAQIIVADDASTDDSVMYVRRAFPDITVVTHKTRQGFAGNVNDGVACATGDVVVLLNTDVQPEKNFLIPLLARFSDPAVAAVGCLEKSHDPGGVVLRGRGLARWHNGYFIHSRGEVDRDDTAWVSGGSAAFRRLVWQEIGGMDTIYNPFYWEDIDLSYQIQKAGYRICFEKKSVVEHFHEEGKIKTSFFPSQVKRIVYRNQYMFHWKNISDPGLVLAHAVWTPVRLLQGMMRGDTAMVAGYLLAVRMLPAVITSRIRAYRHWKRTDRELFSS